MILAPPGATRAGRLSWRNQMLLIVKNESPSSIGDALGAPVEVGPRRAVEVQHRHRAHGVDVGRGRVLLGMAIVQTVASLVIGPLDRVFNTRKWVVVANAAVAVCTLAALALFPGAPLGITVALLLLLSSVSAYGSILLPLFEEDGLRMARLAPFASELGRKVGEAVKKSPPARVRQIAQNRGAALLLIVTGFIPSLFPYEGLGYSLMAYRWIFATLALALGMGLMLYLTANDAKPRGDEVLSSPV